MKSNIRWKFVVMEDADFQDRAVNFQDRAVTILFSLKRQSNIWLLFMAKTKCLFVAQSNPESAHQMQPHEYVIVSSATLHFFYLQVHILSTSSYPMR